MGYTYSDYKYRINGVISTDKTVLQNMEILASAAGAWVTYDTHAGRWSAIINKSEDSIASFNDSNIIGPINVSGTGFTDLYNSVHVEFPHVDLNDQTDYINIDIPTVDRYPNEFDNVLQLQYDIINDPVQAEQLGLIELKQSRIDHVINFVTDFSKIGLKAGDVIDVTNSVYGYDSKKFRIITLTEIDGDEGNLNLEITALEYDENVYNIGDLYRYQRSNSTGITSIGSIGIPGTPTVTLSDVSSRPHITVESTAPTGVVEGMQFWLTNDVPPAVTIDSNRVYKLLETVTPTGNANVFAFGTQVQLDYDKLDNQNFLIKSRGINSVTSGPFSSPTGSIYYAPKQVTDAVSDTTGAINSDGTSALVNALGVATLLNKLSGLFSSNSSAGGLFKTIFDVFNSDTAYDILNDAGNLKTISQDSLNWLKSKGSGPVLLVQSGFATVPYNTLTDYNVTTFTAPYTGYYKVKYNINWGGNVGTFGNVGYPAVGEMGTKTSQISCNKTLVNQGADLSFTGGYSSKYEDHIIEGVFYATATNFINLGLAVEQIYDTTYDTVCGVNAEVTLFRYDQMQGVTLTT